MFCYKKTGRILQKIFVNCHIIIRMKTDIMDTDTL